jgi:hypothetical protein
MLELQFNLGYISPLLFLDDLSVSLRLSGAVMALAYTIS